MKIRNQYDLIREHERLNPDSYMFSKETLRFFGETKRNMRLSPSTVQVRVEYKRKTHECYELSAYGQAEWDDRPTTRVYYFDTETLERILPDDN